MAKKYQSFSNKFIVAEEMSYGWDTVASTDDDNGNTIPLTFDTVDEAKEDIDDHIESINDAIKEGDMSAESQRTVSDFKICEADMDEDGNVIVYSIGNKQDILITFNIKTHY